MVKEEGKTWTWCPVCMVHQDHIWHDEKWHCEICGAYNPAIRVDFAHFYAIVQNSHMAGDEAFWKKKYSLLENKTLEGIRKELPSLAVRAIGSFS